MIGDDDIPPDPDYFIEAVRAFRERTPVTDEEFEAMTREQQERAFTVAAVAQADLVTQVYEEIERAVKDGTSFDDFKRAVGDKLTESWGGEKPGRLETIFRTNVQTAYSAGRLAQLRHPVVKRRRPAWQFSAVKDDRTTDECSALDGIVRKADDDFWATHTPPLHFNCRSTLIPLTQEEAEDEGFESEPGAEAADGFGEPVEDIAAQWEPDTSEYPDEIREILEGRLR